MRRNIQTFTNQERWMAVEVELHHSNKMFYNRIQTFALPLSLGKKMLEEGYINDQPGVLEMFKWDRGFQLAHSLDPIDKQWQYLQDRDVDPDYLIKNMPLINQPVEDEKNEENTA